LNKLFDLLFAPFGSAAAWAMFVVSVVTGVIMLLLFKVSTNQTRLVEAKRRLLGHIYEMGLYQESLRVLFRIQRDLALANLRYLRVTFPALLVIIVPIILIIAQLDARFAHRPFQVQETTLVTAKVASAQDALLDQLTLSSPGGLTVETMPVRDHLEGTATWRIRIEATGDYQLTVAAPGVGNWTKRLYADNGLPRLASTRERATWHQALFNPGEKPLPSDSPLAEITLDLPDRHTRYAGLGMHWLVAFCVFSLLFGIALKDVFKVKI
jgi:hypothetical protein